MTWTPHLRSNPKGRGSAVLSMGRMSLSLSETSKSVQISEQTLGQSETGRPTKHIPQRLEHYTGLLQPPNDPSHDDDPEVFSLTKSWTTSSASYLLLPLILLQALFATNAKSSAMFTAVNPDSTPPLARLHRSANTFEDRTRCLVAPEPTAVAPLFSVLFTHRAKSHESLFADDTVLLSVARSFCMRTRATRVHHRWRTARLRVS